MVTLTNKCQIVRIQTLADGTIRLVIYLLDGTGQSMANAHTLQKEETYVTIVAKESLS